MPSPDSLALCQALSAHRHPHLRCPTHLHHTTLTTSALYYPQMSTVIKSLSLTSLMVICTR